MCVCGQHIWGHALPRKLFLNYMLRDCFLKPFWDNFLYSMVSRILEVTIYTRVVVIELWHHFCDYNYLSLNHQLTPITITNVAYE